MESTPPVQTGLEDRFCRECEKPLPDRPASAKEHHFCNASCRSAWHRKEKQRSLNGALELVRVAIKMQDEGEWAVVKIRLAEIAVKLVRAGAEPA